MSRKGELLCRIPVDRKTLYPNGIDISDDGDIVVADSHGNQFHVAVYNRFGRVANNFVFVMK
jgi:tripartite motif-containing protein 2/3